MFPLLGCCEMLSSTRTGNPNPTEAKLSHITMWHLLTRGRTGWRWTYGNIYFNEWHEGITSAPKERSLDRRETGVTKLMATENGQEVRTRAFRYRRQERARESSQAGHRSRRESEMLAMSTKGQATTLGNNGDSNTATHWKLRIGQISVHLYRKNA